MASRTRPAPTSGKIPARWIPAFEQDHVWATSRACPKCFQLNGSDRAEDLLRSDDHLIAPDLVIAEITNATWKFVIFDSVSAAAAISAVREVAKAFEQLVPTSVLEDRALAIAIALRYPAVDCFYLALAERSAAPLITADDRLIRRCSATSFAKLVQPL